MEANPLLIGLLGVMVGAVVIITYQCIATCYSQRNNTTPNQRDDQPNGNRRTQRSQTDVEAGVRSTRASSSSSTISAITNMPPGSVFKYAKEGSNELGAITCPVCLCEFQQGEAVRVLPHCLHVFHMECIDMWLSSHSSCPICRAEITYNTNTVYTNSASTTTVSASSQSSVQHLIVSMQHFMVV